MKEINMLWIDQDHAWAWEGTVHALEKRYGFKVMMVQTIEDKNILNNCEDKDAIIFHCGTYEPIRDIKKLLKSIKSEYPNIKIGLQTNVAHPHLEEITDFYIRKPIYPRELQELLREEIS